MKLKPRDKTIPFLILLSFLLTFITSRIITAVIPSTVLMIGGVHIHHFTFGILLLCIIAFLTINFKVSYEQRLTLSVFYGIALALAFDEFAMWLKLDNVYYDDLSVNMVIIIGSFLLNVVYFIDFWRRWGKRLGTLIKIIFWRGPYKTFLLIKKLFT